MIPGGHTGLIAALAAGPVCWALMWLAGIRPQGQALSWWWLLQLVLLQPLLEEWLFRGNLQPALKARFSGAGGRLFFSPENLLTSALFAALHLFYHPPLWALLVFFPSLVFGWAMARYRHLLAPFALHAFYNAGYFLLFS
ncbi:JDVT-CTERM system glutamic-type intramembrane protease [Granulosicoccaceae sp. 1_MG-2023]|nr:JDVT-CTERM system glutamic-type intramembrane protease [Granulosicoccaceae sp. 1_MG-2023]